MLKVNLMNMLSEPNAAKCEQLNTLLDGSSAKDLYNYVEYIINFIFSNNQMSGQGEFALSERTNKADLMYRTNWPLKLKNKSHDQLEHDCMFNFLSTKSSLWLSLFKLDTNGAVFRLHATQLPSFIQSRVTDPSSYLSSKTDSFNTLNLNPFEYYLIYFFSYVHDTRTQSRKVFNQQTNCIEIDSVYGDLLVDYLNFFLPLSAQKVSVEQAHLSDSVAQKYEFAERSSLFKKCFTKPTLAQMDLTPTKSTIERTNTIKKIDTFIRLINEILICPFTDQSSSTSIYNQSKHLLTSVECVFTLSMVVRHSHHFSQALIRVDDESAPLAELRHLLFKVYWRKSFYKFFTYNLEHWAFEPNIKWLVELWLNYIEPVRHGLTGLEFICDNYLVISSVYHVILKRLCLVDLTNVTNSQLIVDIMQAFVLNRDNLKKCDCQYMHAKSNKSKSKSDSIRRSNASPVLSVFEQVDERIECFEGLSGNEHMRVVSRLYENLCSAKLMLSDKADSVKRSRSAGGMDWLRALLVDESGSAPGQMSEQDCAASVKSIDTCVELIRLFYEDRVSFEQHVDAKEQQVPGGDEEADYETVQENVVKLTPKGRLRLINRMRKANVHVSYDPETAAIGDFEIRFLVYVCQFVSDMINENFGNFFQRVYTRTDSVGKVAKKCLYLSKRDALKPKLSLRYLASYKFVFYFFVHLLLLNLLTGYSLLFLVPFVLFIYFAYFNLFV